MAKSRDWETFQPPLGAWDLAVRRTRSLPEACIVLRGTGQDWLETLCASAYLQGVGDCAEALLKEKGNDD